MLLDLPKSVTRNRTFSVGLNFFRWRATAKRRTANIVKLAPHKFLEQSHGQTKNQFNEE